MQQIPNVQTAADYTNTTTLGPDAFEAVTVNVWNFSAIMQLFTSPPGGYQVGEWADEVLCPPGQYNLDRCGGVRFKTNPSTPASPARIIAQGWRDGEPRIVGGVEYTTTLSGTGAVTSGLQLTGIVDASGNATAGSGYTSARLGVGRYRITYSTAYAADPDVQVTPISAGAVVAPDLGNLLLGSFDVTWRDVTNSNADTAFTFLVTAMV